MGKQREVTTLSSLSRNGLADNKCVYYVSGKRLVLDSHERRQYQVVEDTQHHYLTINLKYAQAPQLSF